MVIFFRSDKQEYKARSKKNYFHKNFHDRNDKYIDVQIPREQGELFIN